MSPRPPADTSAPPDGPRRVVLVGRLTRSSPVRLRWPVRVPARMNGAEETGDAGARCVDSRGQQGRRDTRFGPSYGKTTSVVLFGADSTSDGDQMGSHRVIAGHRLPPRDHSSDRNEQHRAALGHHPANVACPRHAVRPGVCMHLLMAGLLVRVQLGEQSPREGRSP